MVVRVCIRLRSHFEPARDSLGLGLNPCLLVEPVPVPLPPAFDLDPATGPDTGCQLFGGSGDRGYNGGRGEEGAMHIWSLVCVLVLCISYEIAIWG